ncbi:MAG: anti-sigma factor [Ignavibacteriales bacterium]|nr:anti-sigma factor [Ignavibacteriales bacterium]
MADLRTPDYQSLLYAYSLGCLDKDDFILLVEHLESGESFSWQELGEFQNLSALLPSFLNLEEPSAQVKDKVARRLYRLREDKKQAPPPPTIHASTMPGNQFARTQTQYHKKMKTQIIEAPPKPVTVSERISIPDDEIPVPKEFRPQSSSVVRPTDTARPQQDTQVRNRAQQEAPERPAQPEVRSEFSDFGGIHIPEPAETEKTKKEADEEFIINHVGYANPDEELQEKEYAIPQTPEAAKTASSPGSPDLEAIRRQVVENASRADVEPIEPVEVKAGVSTVLFAIVVLVLLACLAGLYYYMNPKFTQAQAEVNKLREEFQLRVSEVNRGNEVMLLVSAKGSFVVTLQGSNRYPEAYGQFIYNRESKRGMLMIANLPPTAPETGYQLWYDLKDKKIPVGSPSEFGTGGLKIEYFTIPGVPTFPVGEKALLYISVEKLKETPVLPNKERFLETETIFY